MRPLNFSPPNLQKNVWNDISTYQNKAGRGRRQGGRGEAGGENRGCPVESRRPDGG